MYWGDSLKLEGEPHLPHLRGVRSPLIKNVVQNLVPLKLANLVLLWNINEVDYF